MHLIRKTFREHRRIIFNGNNYTKEWSEEAQRRWLASYPDAVRAIEHFADDKNVRLFERHGIYTSTELVSRQEILLDEYAKKIVIEARTMSDMAHREILPALSRFTGRLAQDAQAKLRLNAPVLYERETLNELSALSTEIFERLGTLDKAIDEMPAAPGLKAAEYARDMLLQMLEGLRAPVDRAEMLVGKDDWPFPTYSEMLFSVH